MSSYPHIPFTNIFNPNDFTEIDGSLSLADADARYFKISGGFVSGFSTFLNSLNVIGMLSINSVPIDLSLIAGVTPGLATASKALIVDSSRNITNINSLSTTSLIVNGISIASSDIAYLSGITPGTTTASKAVVVDVNKDIAGLNIISSNGIVMTPTNYTLTSPNIDGCIWRTNSSRISAFRQIDNNNFSWGYVGGGVFSDVLIMSNSTNKITINGDFNLYGQLKISGNVVLDSSQNLTVNDITAADITATSITSPLASIRNNTQANNSRIEYQTMGKYVSSSDYSAWTTSIYYQNVTGDTANYITWCPSAKTSISTGFGLVMNRNGQCSIQDSYANSGSGGLVVGGNIIATLDIYGGVTRYISANGTLRSNATPAVYNAGGGSTRIGLFVQNAIWCSDQIYASSDNRLKRDIEPIELNEAKKLLSVRAVSYRLKKDKFDNFTKSIGFIAQNVIENGLDKLVSYVPNNDKNNFPEGYNYGIEYNRVSIYLLELIKDLYKQIDELKKN